MAARRKSIPPGSRGGLNFKAAADGTDDMHQRGVLVCSRGGPDRRA